MMLMPGDRFVGLSKATPQTKSEMSLLSGSNALTGWLLQGDHTRSHPEHDR